MSRTAQRFVGAIPMTTPTRFLAARLLVAGGLALCLVWARPAAATDEVPHWPVVQSQMPCHKMDREPDIVAIGSSTMRGTLGPMLRRLIKKRHLGFSFTNMAKSSTGLARPDFFDWLARAREIAADGRPDVWVVAMGTNDYQAVRVDKKTWLRPPTDAWRDAYARRVRALLEIMSGPNRHSAVIYVGSTAFGRSASRRIGPLLNAIIREEIERFDGPAFFIDAFSMTSDKKHRAVEYARVPGKRRRIKAFGADGVHLTRTAVQHLMAEPILELLTRCRAAGSHATPPPQTPRQS